MKVRINRACCRSPIVVIPAKAGIYAIVNKMDSCFRRNDKKEQKIQFGNSLNPDISFDVYNRVDKY